MREPSIYQDLSLGYCQDNLSRLIEAENAYISDLASLGRFRLFVKKKLNAELQNTREEKEAIARQLKVLLDCLKKNRALPLITRDPSPWNVSIGNVYGKCICLSDAGELLYICMKDGGVEKGHMVQMRFLTPLSSLPTSQQRMIIRALIRLQDTPGFAREIINKKEKELLEVKKNVSKFQS